jgi:hypothetical protein
MTCPECAKQSTVYVPGGVFDFKCPACCARWILWAFPLIRQDRENRANMADWLASKHRTSLDAIKAELGAQWPAHLERCRLVAERKAAQNAAVEPGA